MRTHCDIHVRKKQNRKFFVNRCKFDWFFRTASHHKNISHYRGDEKKAFACKYYINKEITRTIVYYKSSCRGFVRCGACNSYKTFRSNCFIIALPFFLSFFFLTYISLKRNERRKKKCLINHTNLVFKKWKKKPLSSLFFLFFSRSSVKVKCYAIWSVVWNSNSNNETQERDSLSQLNFMK